MYLVGVIPGPSKPSTDQINHFLRLLVDELLLFWIPGVYYSQTAKYACGRLARAAMVPLVCDILAARQVSGFGAHNHTFVLCTCCKILSDDVENTDIDAIPRRVLSEHRAAAERWLHAESTAERTALFNSNGIRYSELLRLPYWNPIIYTVVDSMHNLYLGILQRHIREFWGVTRGGKSPKRPSVDEMTQGEERLLYGTDESLETCSKAVLYHLCVDRGLRYAGTSGVLTRTLRKWRKKEGLPVPRPAGSIPDIHIPRSGVITASHGPPTVWTERELEALEKSERRLATTSSVKFFHGSSTLKSLRRMCEVRGLAADGIKMDLVDRLFAWREMAKGEEVEMPSASQLAQVEQSVQSEGEQTPHVVHEKGPIPLPTAAIGNQTLQEYEKDRSRMQLPSWINPAPRGFGTSPRGKLSADQWRTIGTINFPITLIRTWGLEEGKRLEFLENFLDLVEAMETLGLMEVDDGHIAEVDRLLKRYLDRAKELYKGCKVQPNHHLALHLSMFLVLFGPVHSWRAFAFERFNYMLQSLNLNLNFGELECTMMMTTCRAANLQALIQHSAIRGHLPAFLNTFDKLSGSDRRGTRMEAILQSPHASLDRPHGDTGKRPVTINLDDGVYSALQLRLSFGEAGAHSRSLPSDTPLSRNAINCSRIIISGVIYRTRHRSGGDSNVIFKHPTITTPAPGSIDLIFVYERQHGSEKVEETFLAVRRLLDLNADDLKSDPYRKYPRVGGALYYNHFADEILVLRPSDVLCHFAKTPMEREEIFKGPTAQNSGERKRQDGGGEKPIVHVKPLERVCNLLANCG
ncbi:hypothetical protein PYCCODRAFT_1358106 [Trametes coccinea BRFM310]|uniref:SAP domain-containing protein n=1 Tax=Trametes coccinea (strain BRFM310) TaxID=1353009 RepID=A0A1Y2J415_TRAC3|nr:hypothetical protein PYCCODRAFT_1358106 [Trametes coccinea BRFM310]